MALNDHNSLTELHITWMGWWKPKSETRYAKYTKYHPALLWRHNGPDGVLNRQPHDCLLNRLFGHRSKKTSKLRVTALCAGNSPETGEFPAQIASNAENVSVWWRHHGPPGWPCYRWKPRVVIMPTISSLAVLDAVVISWCQLYFYWRYQRLSQRQPSVP